jgi:hypothetical protein
MYKWARWINARSDRYKAWIGPVVSALEKLVYGIPEFIKKVPADQRAKLIIDLIDPLTGKLIATDWTNFEATHGPIVMRAVVTTVYLYLTSRNPLARERIMEHLRVRTGTQRLTQREFTIHLYWAILLSGEMDTSLNNGLFNLVTAYYSAWVKSGRTLDLTRQYGFVEGDDGLFKFPEQCVPVSADYTKFGGKCVVDHPDSIHTASFCGNVVDPDNLVLITDPLKFLHNLPYVGKKDLRSGEKRTSMILLSKAMSGAHSYNGAPVISPICWHIIRRFSRYLPLMDQFLLETNHLGVFHREEALSALAYVRTHGERLPTMTSRVFMERVFKLSANEQFRLEHTIPAVPDDGFYQISDRHFHVDHFNSFHLSSSMHGFSHVIRRSGHPLHHYQRLSGPGALSMSFRAGAYLTISIFCSYLTNIAMNVKPTASALPRYIPTQSSSTSKEERVIPPPAAKAARLSTLTERIAQRAPDNQKRAGGAPQSRQGHQGEKTKEKIPAQSGHRMVGLGDPKGQGLRTPAVRAFERSSLVLARLAPHLPANRQLDNETGLRPPSRLVSNDELKEACSLAGVDHAAIPKGAQVFIHSPADNAVMPSNDMTVVSSSVGSQHIAGESIKMNEDGTIEFTSSEYLQPIVFPPQIGSVPTSVPVGAGLAMYPANPRFVDGSRLAAFLSNYDQFQLVKVIYRYISGATFTQSGQGLMVFINDVDDEIVSTVGLSAIRDAYTRPGRALFPWIKDAAVHMGMPLLKWYYTASGAGPAFELPGFVMLMNQLAITNTGAAIPLGSLVVEYTVRVRSPTTEINSSTALSTQSESLPMTLATITIDDAATITAANSLMSASSILPAAVYWAQIAAHDDTGPGTAAWRTWYDPTTGRVVVLQAGNFLIWRVTKDGNIYFYPTLGCAFLTATTGDLYTPAFRCSATVASGTVKGFKLYNISGTNADGYNVIIQ